SGRSAVRSHGDSAGMGHESELQLLPEVLAVEIREVRELVRKDKVEMALADGIAAVDEHRTQGSRLALEGGELGIVRGREAGRGRRHGELETPKRLALDE